MADSLIEYVMFFGISSTLSCALFTVLWRTVYIRRALRQIVHVGINIQEEEDTIVRATLQVDGFVDEARHEDSIVVEPNRNNIVMPIVYVQVQIQSDCDDNVVAPCQIAKPVY